ncbi:MAG TPA: class I SAM-dependent methyltransferase [Actinobacteria bacterium]|nr:class I SAM-dependent methyltransferase [Actinomycetota bacterium]
MSFSQDWFSPHIPHLSRLLAGLRGVPGLSFLEIGSFEGRSTVWFLQQVLTGAGSTITCIDTFRGSAEHSGLDVGWDDLQGTFRRNVDSFGSRVRVIEGESAVVLRGMPRQEAFDLVYVDGSHQATDVLEDGVLSWPLLKVGGIMVFDDYLWRMMESRPGPAIDAFLAVYADRYDLLHKEYQVAVRKRAMDGPPGRHFD